MPSGVWRVVDWCRGWSLHPAALGRRVTLNCDDARSAVKELINVAVPRSWPHATYKHTFPILFGWVAADWIAKGKMAGLWRVHSPDASIRFVAARRGKSGLALRRSLCNPQLVNADNLSQTEIQNLLLTKYVLFNLSENPLLNIQYNIILIKND